MATFEVYNLERQKVGDIELADAVFGAEVKEHLFWEVIRWQQAKTRSGSAKAKTRSEVSGGNSKPYRQKGTGRARQGSTRAPQHAGGGRAFPPRPRDWSYTIPKKVRKGALRSALSLRVQENRLLIVDSFNLAETKTKVVLGVLDKLGLSNSSCLIVDEPNDVLALSTRNLQKVKFLPRIGLNLFDLLKHETLIMTRDSAKMAEGVLMP